MCGIAGQIRFDGRAPDPLQLSAMTDQLVHRGPDDEGFAHLGPVAFGHRRLSIIDLAGSPQPMSTPDGRFTICFNGEILNYQELRERHRLPCRTSGDTEVLMLLVSQHGPGILNEIRGQFGFALHDASDGSVLLARDRAGILPVFWSHQPWGVAFASEVKALRPAIGSLSLDEASLADFLLQRFVPAPHTLYAGVRKLRPGGWLRITADGSVTEGAYWTLHLPTPRTDLDETSAVDELDALMRTAVEEALVADVPVGAYLSGGVDSSVTVSLAAQARPGARLVTFAAGFAHAEIDERPAARRVSERWNTDHHEVLVSPDNFFEELGRLSWYRDFPISEPADPAVAALSKLAREHVKVVVSGEGSDELFGGYAKYKLAAASGLAGRVPTAIRAPLADVMTRTIGTRKERLAVLGRSLAGDSEADRIRAWFSPFTQRDVTGLCGRPARRLDALDGVHGDMVAKFGIVDLAYWLPDNLLERGDRMTMTSSVELRPPFLDTRVVDFALALPSRFKVRRGDTKWVVKQVAKRYVDADLIDRPKIGFAVPIDSWFRGHLAGEVRDLLCGPDSHVAQWLDAAAVRRLVDDHIAGAKHGKQLWPLVSLELWARHALDAAAPPR